MVWWVQENYVNPFLESHPGVTCVNCYVKQEYVHIVLRVPYQSDNIMLHLQVAVGVFIANLFDDSLILNYFEDSLARAPQTVEPLR